MIKISRLPWLILLLYTLSTQQVSASEDLTVTLASGEDLNVEQYPATGDYLMLWLAPEYGFRENHRSLAKSVSEQGIEIWMSNIQESLFMPDSSRSIKELKGQVVAGLIRQAREKTNKQIIVSSDSYGSILALRGIHQWQIENPGSDYLVGAVLFSPYTFAYIPELGELPEYLPIVSATNIPIMIYQSRDSAIYGQFETLREKLGQHGNPVYSRITPGVMSLFYEKEPTGQMRRQARLIPVNLKKMISVLSRHPLPRETVALKTANVIKSGINVQLNTFKTGTRPLTIDLIDTSNHRVTKKDYRGKVTVINFWATWCPPCIEEIPSLNRLKKKMQGQPFELISINYAEDTVKIENFMHKVKVDFPVLLDPDGEFAHQWNVISYPSTFVIDSRGEIRYGVNAAIEWDDEGIIDMLKSLM